MDDVDAVEVFARDPVDIVGLFLHLFHTGYNHYHNDDYHCEQSRHKARRNHRKLPALADYLDYGPYCHDGGLDYYLKAHSDQHLNLRDIVCRTVDKAWNRKLEHLLLPKVSYLVEYVLAYGIAEPRRDFGREKAAYYAERRAGQHAAKH